MYDVSTFISYIFFQQTLGEQVWSKSSIVFGCFHCFFCFQQPSHKVYLIREILLPYKGLCILDKVHGYNNPSREGSGDSLAISGI